MLSSHYTYFFFYLRDTWESTNKNVLALTTACSSRETHVNPGIHQVEDEWGAQQDIMESVYREIHVHVYEVCIELTFEIPDFGDLFYKTNFSRLAGTSEAEASLSGKAKCFLVIGKDKKSISFLE